MRFCLRGRDRGGVPPIFTIRSSISWEGAPLEAKQQPRRQGPDAHRGRRGTRSRAPCPGLGPPSGRAWGTVSLPDAPHTHTHNSEKASQSPPPLC